MEQRRKAIEWWNSQPLDTQKALALTGFNRAPKHLTGREIQTVYEKYEQAKELVGSLSDELPMWKRELAKVSKCPQRQDGVSDQLYDLIGVANQLGFYDAADFIEQQLEK